MPNLRGKTWEVTTPAEVTDAQYWEDHLISDADQARISSAVQTVNNIPVDENGNVDVVALPPGGTTGQVLTKISNTSGDADWLDAAGHTIQDADGDDMPSQNTLQFLGADVANDSVNGKTVVDCHGQKGDAATIAVGTVTTLPAGSSATVTNSGTSSAAVFNFGIPEGEPGTGASTWGSITGTLSDQIDLQTELDSKQDVLTAGDGIDITTNIVSVDTQNTYIPSGTGSDKPISGQGVAAAIADKAEDDDLDDFTASLVAYADGTAVKVAFDNLNPNYGYKIFFDDKNQTWPSPLPSQLGDPVKSAGTTTGTIKLTYTLSNAVAGSHYFSLRIFK